MFFTILLNHNNVELINSKCIYIRNQRNIIIGFESFKSLRYCNYISISITTPSTFEFIGTISNIKVVDKSRWIKIQILCVLVTNHKLKYQILNFKTMQYHFTFITFEIFIVLYTEMLKIKVFFAEFSLKSEMSEKIWPINF